MDSSKIDSKITRAAASAAHTVETLAKKGGDRLRETAEKAKHAVETVGLKAVHAAEQRAHKMVDDAKEMVSKARQHR
jgi:hypothetical protein